MSQTVTQKERRKYYRMDRNCVLRCEKFSAKNFNEKELQDAAGGLVKNISAGGILFETNQSYPIGTLLKVELKLKGWEKFKSEFYKLDVSSNDQPLVVLAKVTRVELIKSSEIYDIGLSIVSIDEGHREALKKFISRRASN